MTLNRRCSWSNYRSLIVTLDAIGKELSRQAKVPVRLIDARSFIWVLGSWERPDEHGVISHQGGTLHTAGKEKALRRMVFTIKDTIRRSNGQLVNRRIKDKFTDMTDQELVHHIIELLDESRNCKLTGCTMLYDGEERTPFQKNFLVSPDRINSDLGYVGGNIQLVCQFANFFKGGRYSDAVFQQLLEHIRRAAPTD